MQLLQIIDDDDDTMQLLQIIDDDDDDTMQLLQIIDDTMQLLQIIDDDDDDTMQLLRPVENALLNNSRIVGEFSIQLTKVMNVKYRNFCVKYWLNLDA